MWYNFTVVHIQVSVINITYLRRYLTYLGNSMCVIIPSFCRTHCTSLGLVHINTGPCHVYNFTVVHIQVSVINITYLRRYLTYLGNSMCVIIPSFCRTHCTSLGLVHINTGPCHVYNFTVIHIQVSVINITYLRRYLTYLNNSMCVTIPSWCRIHCTLVGLVHINTGRCHVIWFYCCSYTGISNQHNVSPSLFDISRELYVRYNPFLVPYTLHVTRISPYKHWSLSCDIILLLFIYRYQ
jgi:hypothetical protein